MAACRKVIPLNSLEVARILAIDRNAFGFFKASSVNRSQSLASMELSNKFKYDTAVSLNAVVAGSFVDPMLIVGSECFSTLWFVESLKMELHENIIIVFGSSCVTSSEEGG